MSAFTPDPDWLPLAPPPSKPWFEPPPGAADAHCHVFGPGDRFPYAPERKYTPCDAGKEKLWALRDFLGFERNVIVQATCHGADNRAKSGPPDYSDVVPFARRIVERFPDRVLWGTDWPHPNMKSRMPDDGKLVDYIPRIASTPDLQCKLLVENPMRLYWSD